MHASHPRSSRFRHSTGTAPRTFHRRASLEPSERRTLLSGWNTVDGDAAKATSAFQRAGVGRRPLVEEILG